MPQILQKPKFITLKHRISCCSASTEMLDFAFARENADVV